MVAAANPMLDDCAAFPGVKIVLATLAKRIY